MKKYIVRVVNETDYEVEVEAENESDASDKARAADPDEFVTTGGTWNFDDVEEITP